MLKKTLSVIAGIVAANLIIYFGGQILSKSFPDFGVFNELKGDFARARMAHVPKEAWISLILIWMFCSFVCGYLVKLISHSSKMIVPIGCGAFLTIGVISTFIERPHPTWVIIIGILIFIPMTYLGDISCKTRVLTPEQEALEEEQDLA